MAGSGRQTDTIGFIVLGCNRRKAGDNRLVNLIENSTTTGNQQIWPPDKTPIQTNLRRPS
jgi:hypothetical protein